MRHETHMAETETKRIRMLGSIDELESDKKRLESSNATIIKENRKLLNQLEDINEVVSQSDARIESLTATIRFTRQELQRLTVLAGRTAQLEAQLTNMEDDHARLESQLASNEVETKTALQRWKRAEGTISYLQEQIDKIEKEAKEERDRHVEVLGRMERQKAVEKELEKNTDRSKSAAAARSTRQTGDTGVVSHFVRDILQDNANLQMGVVELRGMLMGSNAEVESLREHLLLHQPLQSDTEWSVQPILSTEISKAERILALHVHHHYHASDSARKQQKRAVVNPGHFASSSGTSTPRDQRIKDWRAATPSSVATILSQTSVTVPPVKRCSMQSAKTASSFSFSSRPSSPQATSSIFDNIDNAFDFSRPTSPESIVAWGSPPKLRNDLYHEYARHTTSSPVPLKLSPLVVAKKVDPIGLAGNGSLNDITDVNPPESPILDTFQSSGSAEYIHSPGHDTIMEEDEHYTKPTSVSFLQELSSRPGIRRATSHESLLISPNMDVHKLRYRPSQGFSGRGVPPQSPYSPIVASLASTSTVISPTTAVSLRPSQRQDSGEYTRSILAQARGDHDRKQPLGKRVGGWVWNKWGVVPIPLSKAQTQCQLETVLRSPGVNQRGPIRGLRPPNPPPSNVEPETVDRALLEESLADA